MVDVLETATGARRQPLLFEITTAGYDRHSICYEHHDYSIKVLEGTVPDDSWFAFIAAADEGKLITGRQVGPATCLRFREAPFRRKLWSRGRVPPSQPRPATSRR